MTPAAIIREAQSEGVRLRLSATGTIKATGNGAAVNRWLDVIRENKASIVEALKEPITDTRLARNRDFGKVATATLATEGGTVAVANPKNEIEREAFEERAAIMEFDGELPRVEAERLAALDAFSFWWRLYFPDGVQREICVPSGDTRARMLARYPAALRAEPFALGTVKPDAPLTEGDKRAILAWLASIGEDDPVTIAEVIEGCQNNQDRRAYFLARASETGRS